MATAEMELTPLEVLPAECHRAQAPGAASEAMVLRWPLQADTHCPHPASIQPCGSPSVSFPPLLSPQIWVRKTSDSTKMRIYLGQLQRGLFVIRRRSAA